MARLPSSRPDDYDRLLGQLVCDRLGLNPHHIARDDFTHELINGRTVMVRATVIMTLPADDFMELQVLAHTRHMAAQPPGPVG